MNKNLVKSQAQGIQSREQFMALIDHVNELTRKNDIPADEAKATLRKAEALRAWASFDRSLTDEEKKEANRAMSRTVLMLCEVAEREQPGLIKGRVNGPGRRPGPPVWLSRELKITISVANCMRQFFLNEELRRSVIEKGVHWRTVMLYGGGRRPSLVLSKTAEYTKANNSLSVALKVLPIHLKRELTRIRHIKAWCEAYEHALMKRLVQQKKVQVSDTSATSDSH